MMYNQKMVVSVKCNGDVLREHGEDVFLPFGAEYSILLKNLHTRKALVDVYVDGREAISGLIVYPTERVELERFFEGDMNSGHRFKFIEKTEEIENYRGNRIEDGLIRVEYQFEQERPRLDPWKPIWNDWVLYRSGPDFTKYGNISSSISSQNVSRAACLNDAGITVEGDYSNQSFTHGNIGQLELERHSIVLRLRGESGKGKVQKPLQVRTKIQCHTCGRRNTSRNKFCGNCGTAMI